MELTVTGLHSSYCSKSLFVQRIFMFLSVFIFSTILVAGQSNQPSAAASNENIPGRLLSKGNNRVPAGKLQILTYKLEEIKPTRNVRTRNRTLDLTGFRLTISAAKQLTGGSYLIWIDDNSYNAPTMGLHKLCLILEAEKLPDGARLAVSPLLRENDDVQSNLSVLPESLSVPSPYGYNVSEFESRNNYLLKRVSKYVGAGKQKVSGVEIEVPSEDEYTVGADIWVIQVGAKEYFASVESNALTIWFSDEEFARLNNGDKIKVKYGSGSLVNGRVVGKLNKGLLQ
jgi:hypothetical protein